MHLGRTLAGAIVCTALAGASAVETVAGPPAHGLPSPVVPAGPEFFPIAVWVQSPRNAARYKAIGVNVYVGLWRGPTVEQLDALERAGMYAICRPNKVALENLHRKVIAGWMHNDEPDNAQSLGRGKGWGPPVPPEQIIEDYRKLKAQRPDLPVLLNLGQGVAWDQWHGRGVRRNHPEDYPEYVKGCDIASFDIYPVTHESPEVAGKLEYVGRGVRRLVEWTRGRKPVWCCIETTHVGNANARPTPAQVRAEVWIALIHGATGIIYFCHEFQPREIEAGLLARPEMAEGVKAINAEVMRLAPVLNSQTVPDAVTVETSEATVPIATLCKRRDGATYVFAAALREAPTTGSFTVKGLTGKAKVEVLGEGRSLEADEGRFRDTFEGYGVHLYRVAP